MRTLDATIVNRIVNSDVEIMRAVGLDPANGPVDFTDCCERPSEYIVMDNRVDGAAIFEWSSPGIWQGHTIFAKTCRGAQALDWGREFLREMFTEWGAEEIWGQTPVHLRAALAFNLKLGGKAAGEGHHFHSGAVKYFRFKRDEWLSRHG